MRAVGLPPELTRGGNILRPKDAARIYAQPWTEFKRLADLGVLKKMATGYYAIVPLNRVGDHRWQPDLETVALGIAQADYGTAEVALMGTSAVRLHGVIPRPLGEAVVAVPKQRPVLATEAGTVTFVKRDVNGLELERVLNGWVTTVEQTFVDLAARPALGGLPEADIVVALRDLRRRSDADTIERLARDQHKPRALRYAKEVLDA